MMSCVHAITPVSRQWNAAISLINLMIAINLVLSVTLIVGQFWQMTRQAVSNEISADHS